MGRVFGAVLVASLALAACGGKCEESADVLLEVEGDDALLAHVGSVVFTLTVGGTKVEYPQPVMTGPLESGSTILLSAMDTPLTATYQLEVDASLRAANLVEIATGTVMGTVGSHACNELRLPVTADEGDMAIKSTCGDGSCSL